MRKLLNVLGTIVIVSMVLAMLGIFVSPAGATPSVVVHVTSWPVDVHNPDSSFGAPIAIFVASGNPSWTSGFSVTGSSLAADFTMKYQKTTDGEIVDEVPVTPAVPAHCPTGFAKNIDPANPDLCAQLKSPAEDAYYVYIPEIPAVDPVMGCPEGYTLGLDTANPTKCAKVTGSHQELVTPAHCPDGFATGIDPKHPSECAKADPLTYHTECDKGCAPVVFSDSRLVCPSGYSEHAGTCRKWVIWHYVYADKITETYGPISIPYNKSCDQNKCHRPDDGYQTGELRKLFPGMPDWVANDITSNKLNDHANPGITPEWMDQVDINCHQVADPQTYSHADMIPAVYETVIDYGYADEVIVTPGVPAYCPEGYTKGLDVNQPDACAKLIPAVDAAYTYADMIPEVPAVYGCPEGTTPIQNGKCQYPSGTTYSYVEFLLNKTTQPTPPPSPVFKPTGRVLWSVEKKFTDPKICYYWILDGNQPSDRNNLRFCGPLFGPGMWIHPHDYIEGYLNGVYGFKDGWTGLFLLPDQLPVSTPWWY